MHVCLYLLCVCVHVTVYAVCCVRALCVVFCCGVSAGAVRSQVTKHGTCRQMLASRRLFWCEHDSGAGGLGGDGDGAPDDGDGGPGGGDSWISPCRWVAE